MADISHCKAGFFYKIKRSGDTRYHSFPLYFFFFIPIFILLGISNKPIDSVYNVSFSNRRSAFVL